MTGKTPNLAASVRQRLLNLSREGHGDFQRLLTRYALERLLYRLSCSESADAFVLKGALLFNIWFATPLRPTRDVDLLGYGEPEPERLAEIFRALAQMPLPAHAADGLEFAPDSVHAEAIREAARYSGVRVTLTALLDRARIPVQCDIGFGDAVTPAAQRRPLPVLLGLPAPELRVYPAETVVAEKLEALVTLGEFNSRMKDFFDLWVLFTQGELDRSVLPQAVAATFARRGTPLPTDTPVGLLDCFAAERQSHWNGFLLRNALTAPPLEELIGLLRSECMPLLHSARALGD